MEYKFNLEVNMLQFVIGTAGTGKSTYVRNEISKLARAGKKCVLIVPEQFSKIGETLLFDSIDPGKLDLVQLYSFSQLLRKAKDIDSRLKADEITQRGKIVLAHRAVKEVTKELNIFKKQAGNLTFAQSLTDVFDAFRRSGLDGQTIGTLCEKSSDEHIKLKELNLIYSVYCAYLDGKFIDEEGLLNILAGVIPRDIFAGANVFFDGFENFSGGQTTVINGILEMRENVTITMTCDNLTDDTFGTGNFSYVQNTIAKLTKSARKIGVKIASPKKLETPVRFKNDDLIIVDKYLRGIDINEDVKGHVFATKFDTQYEEVAFTRAEITKLVRSGYSYNDIAVVCPQLEKYENQIQESFALANIPYFIDAGRIISSSAAIMLFKNIFDIIAHGFSIENIMSILRTGLTKVSYENIDLLDNYLFVWQDFNFDFSADFTLPTGGIDAGKIEKDAERLKRINDVRKFVYECFDGMVGNDEPNSGEGTISSAYEFAKKLGALDKIEQMTDKAADEESKNLMISQWEGAVEMLDNLFTIINTQQIRASELLELFTIMSSALRVGFSPQTQDCVMVSEPKRMKLDSVEAVFVIGADSEFFPCRVDESGIVTVADREFLKENNYILSDNFENRFGFENLYFYKALTIPRQWLFVSVAEKNIDLSQSFGNEIEAMAEKLKIPPAQLSIEEYAVSSEFFKDYVSCTAENHNRIALDSMLKTLGLNALHTSEKEFGIEDKKYLSKVLGNEIYISPTQTEDYHKCRFMYFMKNVLKIRPLNKSAFDIRLAGTYLHYVAGEMLRLHGDNFKLLKKNEIEIQVYELVQKYLSEKFPAEILSSAKFKAQNKSMSENAVNFMLYVWELAQNSSFVPLAFEMPIDENSAVKPLDITTKQNHKVKVIGIVDRVDIYRGETKDYLMVVDYKTGNQTFSLDEVYNGLSSQLLIYIAALLNSNFGKRNKDISPRTVVYQHADAKAKFDKDSENLYTAEGMCLSNDEIKLALDNTSAEENNLISKGHKPYDSLKYVDEDLFNTVLNYVKKSVSDMADNIYTGDFSPFPLDLKSGKLPCDYCAYSSFCRHTQIIRTQRKNNFKDNKIRR
jgi:ATP-dependent helicase/nuclease subunit B